MIDVRWTREAYDQETIEHLGWKRRDQNIADPMTKLEISALMKHFKQYDTLDYHVEQYVVRNATNEIN